LSQPLCHCENNSQHDIENSKPAISLKVESVDREHPYVDADEFLTTAKK